MINANFKLGRFVIGVKVAYISKINHLVGEHAFPLMGFVCLMAHVTNSGSDVMSAALPCNAQAKIIIWKAQGVPQ